MIQSKQSVIVTYPEPVVASLRNCVSYCNDIIDSTERNQSSRTSSKLLFNTMKKAQKQADDCWKKGEETLNICMLRKSKLEAELKNKTLEIGHAKIVVEQSTKEKCDLEKEMEKERGRYIVANAEATEARQRSDTTHGLMFIPIVNLFAFPFAMKNNAETRSKETECNRLKQSLEAAERSYQQSQKNLQTAHQNLEMAKSVHKNLEATEVEDRKKLQLYSNLVHLISKCVPYVERAFNVSEVMDERIEKDERLNKNTSTETIHQFVSQLLGHFEGIEDSGQDLSNFKKEMKALCAKIEYVRQQEKKKLALARQQEMKRLELARQQEMKRLELARQQEEKKKLALARQQDMKRLELGRQQEMKRLVLGRQQEMKRLEFARQQERQKLELNLEQNETNKGLFHLRNITDENIFEFIKEKERKNLVAKKLELNTLLWMYLLFVVLVWIFGQD